MGADRGVIARYLSLGLLSGLRRGRAAHAETISLIGQWCGMGLQSPGRSGLRIPPKPRRNTPAHAAESLPADLGWGCGSW